MNEAETRRVDRSRPQSRGLGRRRRQPRASRGDHARRLQAAGKRAEALKCDYVLTYRNKQRAVIEAKRRDFADTEGVGQAKNYASMLQARFAYSTNGAGI